MPILYQLPTELPIAKRYYALTGTFGGSESPGSVRVD